MKALTVIFLLICSVGFCEEAKIDHDLRGEIT
jgi:hypothetical protein